MKKLVLILSFICMVSLANAQNPPTVTTSTATGISCNSATLNGIVNPDGSNATWHFSYGILSILENATSDQTILANSGDNNVSITITGLTPNTAYIFVLTATNTDGTAQTAPLTFTTASQVTPIVVISANPGATVCSGTCVTFTANPTYGGTNPAFQWILNGGMVGTNSSTFSNCTGGTVTCWMTSNETCVTSSLAISNQVIMTVNNINATISADHSSICEGACDTITAGGGGTYQWSSPPGGTNAAIIVCPTSTTTYTVTVTATNGCSATEATTINVNPIVPVDISITANPGSTICLGLCVTFTASPTNGGTTPSYQWQKNGTDVAGATSSTWSGCSLANNDAITCVMTSNANCVSGSPATSNIITMTVTTVNANAIATTSSICQGNCDTLVASGGVGYQWCSPPGGTNDSIIVCPSTSTSYCVTVSDINGCTATTSVMIHVNPLTASVSVTANPTGPICSGSCVTFTATPTNGGPSPSFQWRLNGQIVGTNSSTYSNCTLANGNLVKCWMASNAPCITNSPTLSNVITEIVNPTVAASVNISANPSGTVCEGAVVTFTATPVNGGAIPSYQWHVGTTHVGTNSSTFSISATNGDAITCEMTSSNVCSSGSPATSNVINITTNPNLPVSISISANPGSSICSGVNVTFTAAPTNGGTTPSYQWQLNGNAVGTNSSTYANASLVSNDHVTCVLTSNLSCPTGNPTTSNTISMIVNSVTAQISATPSTVCQGDCSTISATGGTIFVWNNGTTTPTIVVCPATTSSYTVTVEAPNGCSGSAQVTIIVDQLAPPIITQNGSNLQSSTASTYQWYLNGNIITGATSQIFSPLQNGNYTVTVTDVNGCTATSALFNVTWLGIIENDNDNFISIFPNPAAENITIETPLKATIEILNIQGQIINTIIDAEKATTIDLTGVTSGVYIIKALNEKGMWIRKFVKE